MYGCAPAGCGPAVAELNRPRVNLCRAAFVGADGDVFAAVCATFDASDWSATGPGRRCAVDVALAVWFSGARLQRVLWPEYVSRPFSSGHLSMLNEPGCFNRLGHYSLPVFPRHRAHVHVGVVLQCPRAVRRFQTRLSPSR